MAAIIEALREEHRNIARLLGALEHQINVFARAGAPDYEVIRGIAEYFLDYPDQCHHPKEDAVFERWRDKFPSAAAAVGDLAREHRDTRERARRFRDAVCALLDDRDVARDAIVRVARDFIEAERRHMRREEEDFFPAVEKSLQSEDWSRIDDALAHRGDPLFGSLVEEKFKDLRERLLVWERGSYGA